MFRDIVEIMTFVVAQIENNQINNQSCIEIYDVYRELYILHEKARLVISYLSREVDETDIHTSHGTPTKKWIWFNNKQMRAYENRKYNLFCKISRLDNNDIPNVGILASNFVSKSINCKVDEYTKIMNIDNDLRLHVYKFNFITSDYPPVREFEKLFFRMTFDISSIQKKTDVIEETTLDNERILKLIFQLQSIMVNRCSVDDFFIL